MPKDLYTAVKERRSIYGINSEISTLNFNIQEIVKHAVKHSPSAFNSQGSRVVMLFGNNHHKLWDITKDALKEVVPEDKFSATEEKLKSFKSGYGTVLFFEDMSVVKSLQEKFPTYKDNFPVWAQQSNGMLQYVIWTSLEAEGLGASLQHYTELIEKRVKEEWNIEESWKLIAQMPFGNPTSPPNEKEFLPIEERVKVF